MEMEEDRLDRGADDADYDLSEEAGYADWDSKGSFPIGKWLIVGVSVLLVLALVLPLVLSLVWS